MTEYNFSKGVFKVKHNISFKSIIDYINQNYLQKPS